MKAFCKKGIRILHPESTWIDDSVCIDRIDASAIIHPGCRISGAGTSIGPGCVIGEETPATITDCQLGANVELKGGFFSGSVFLDRVAMSSDAHVRPCCVLEEDVSCGHAVGLKQTVLFPFTALGSLVNFCDCLMAGGTGKENHSEVGSSYVHFNYSPRRHKATASLFGDVPRGVMLDQQPIFLGGQAGSVGPAMAEYGTLTAAGTVLRRDISEPGKLVFGSGSPRMHQRRFISDSFGDISPTVEKNLSFIASLHALREWYRHIRCIFDSNPFTSFCHIGAIDCISEMIAERLKRLEQFAARIASCSSQADATYDGDQSFLKRHESNSPLLAANITYEGDCDLRDAFMDRIDGTSGYLAAIEALDNTSRSKGTAWLSSVIRAAVAAWHS